MIWRGTQERPKGPLCLKCGNVWSVGGWREEYDDNLDKLIDDVAKDDEMQQSWTDCTSLWLESHNQGKRIRQVRSERYKKRIGENSIFGKMQQARESRSKVLKKENPTAEKQDFLEILHPRSL